MEGIPEFSATIDWYNQSNWKLVLAKRTHHCRAVLTKYAVVCITNRMIDRMP